MDFNDNFRKSLTTMLMLMSQGTDDSILVMFCIAEGLDLPKIKALSFALHTFLTKSCSANLICAHFLSLLAYCSYL